MEFGKSIKIRSFPYPFKAGLAICSDIDDCDMENFIKIHRFLNSEKKGLGLPVADSFFGVASSINYLAYFNPDGSDRPKEAEFIRQAIQDRLIDSIHSWGDFNNAPPNPYFLQSIAGNLTESFVKFGLNIPIWINHGSPNNQQNLFARIHDRYQGDDPSSDMYTMKFIKALGVKYYWASELVTWPLSTASQNIMGKKIRRILLNDIKNIMKLSIGRSSRVKSWRQELYLNNTITLRDKNQLIAFTRFARHNDKKKIWQANRNTLRYSLSIEVLDELINDEGYIIIYTHLAKPSIMNNESLFCIDDEKALRNLSEYYRKGLVWVTTTSSLINFQKVYNNIKFGIDTKKDCINIDIKGINDPVYGFRIPDVDDLAGICFYSPMVQKTSISLLGVRTPVVIFETDHNGGGFIGFNIPEAPKTELLEY